MTVTTGPTIAPSLWRGPLGAVTVGLFSLAFMVAFEALAVVTVMPLVVDELSGLSLYAVAFGAPVAVSIYSRSAAVPWVERAGPGPALRAGVLAFVAGLVACALATSMPVFLAGRAVQGLGMGAIGVTIYVVVAQAYPESLRPRAMTVLTSAWMLPAVIGPGIAGWLAHLVGWRAVFWVAPVLAVVSLTLTWRVVARLTGDGTAVRSGRRDALAGVVAAAVLLLAVAGQRDLQAWPVLLVLAVLAVVALAPHLVVPGTWTARRGLPALMASRTLLAAAYFGAESYVPLGLVEVRGLSVGTAGLVLTAAAFAWFGGSWAVAHPERLGPVLATPGRRTGLGAAAVVLGLLAGLLVLVPWVPTAVVALVWGVGGLGMGAAMSATTVQMLDRSGPGEEAGNSAAMQTNDAVGESAWIALGSVLFAAVLREGVEPALVSVVGASVLVGLLGLLLLRRADLGQ